MTQANCIVNSIRELMSRGKPSASTNSARAAHTEFVAAFAANPPKPIWVECNCDDMEARAEHVEKALAAFNVYLSAFLADTDQHITRRNRLDVKYIGNLYSDLESEIVGGLKRAADDLRDDEHRRAE